MSATTTAKRKGRKVSRVPAEFPAATWEIRDSLNTEVTFSVVPRGGCGFVVEPGRVAGALATFTELADMEASELEADGCLALRQVEGYRNTPFAAVKLDECVDGEYLGGQALHLAGKVGVALREREMLGHPWPEAGCLASRIGYPAWLVQVSLDEYKSQRDG